MCRYWVTTRSAATAILPTEIRATFSANHQRRDLNPFDMRCQTQDACAGAAASSFESGGPPGQMIQRNPDIAGYSSPSPGGSRLVLAHCIP